MKVRFLVDYRGKLTDERFFEIGSEADLPGGSDLVAAGRAEPVVDEEPELAVAAPVEITDTKPAPSRGRPKKGDRIKK